MFTKAKKKKKDPKLKDYLANVLSQVENWAGQGSLQQLVMVIARVDTGESLERWVFNVETDKAAVGDDGAPLAPVPKTVKEIRASIAAIMRQISGRFDKTSVFLFLFSRCFVLVFRSCRSLKSDARSICSCTLKRMSRFPSLGKTVTLAWFKMDSKSSSADSTLPPTASMRVLRTRWLNKAITNCRSNFLVLSSSQICSRTRQK